MIYSGQVLTKIFFTYNGFGMSTDADSLPTGTLVVNGADNGATVTVTKLSTGRYKATVTLPELAVGDVVDLSITATVGGVARSAVAYTDVAGVSAPSVADVQNGLAKTDELPDLTDAEAALVKLLAALYDPSTVEEIDGEFWTRLSNNVLMRVDPEVGRAHGTE